MPRYSEERKASVLKKLLPPQNRSVVSVAAEEGFSLESGTKAYKNLYRDILGS